MSAGELSRRRATEHDSEVLREREKEYDMSKVELARQMIKRAIRRGIKFSYVLRTVGLPIRILYGSSTAVMSDAIGSA